MINFSLNRVLLNQKANRPDDEIKRGDERPLCGENNNTITFTFMIMQMLYYAVKKENRKLRDCNITIVFCVHCKDIVF